jgi:YD repeat-containing protein
VIRERGFAFVELLVSIAIFVGIGLALLTVVLAISRVPPRDAIAPGGTLAVEQEIDELRSDAATSFAVFVPDRDVHGGVNVDPASGLGHEVDFYSRDDAGGPVFWAYLWDAAGQTLERYDYDGTGNIGEADRTTGKIETGTTYPKIPGVTAFAVRTLEATDLIGSKSAYAPVMAPLFSGLVPKALPVGFNDGVTARPDLYGGNTTVEVKLSTQHERRTVHLASTAMPSGFTIHQDPEVRAIVYRHDTTDRSWLGLVQKSHVFIQARLLISYSHFTEPHPIIWCDYNLYGYPHGLQAPYQADANYQPTWFPETTAGIVYHVVRGRTLGSTCSKAPPRPGPGSTPSAFFSPPPDSQDSPPPCFLAGKCWPPDAPVDFSPSAIPAAAPPAWWCGTHAQSALCGRSAQVPLQAPSAARQTAAQ